MSPFLLVSATDAGCGCVDDLGWNELYGEPARHAAYAGALHFYFPTQPASSACVLVRRSRRHNACKIADPGPNANSYLLPLAEKLVLPRTPRSEMGSLGLAQFAFCFCFFFPFLSFFFFFFFLFSFLFCFCFLFLFFFSVSFFILSF